MRYVPVLFPPLPKCWFETACRKAVEGMACLLPEVRVLHMIWLERRSQTKQKKKITAAAYLDQVDNDGK